MARTSYDDWNFMGEVHKEEIKNSGSKPKKNANSQRNSFMLICLVAFMTFLGLVFVYSASYETAVAQGLEHYYYLVRQACYVAIGAVLFILVNIIPQGLLRGMSPVAMIICLLGLVFDTFTLDGAVFHNGGASYVFLSYVLYLSVFFSNRSNNIERLRNITIPGACCLVLLALILVNRNFAYAMMFLGLAVVMFAAGGVGIFGIVLVVLYAVVPLVCAVLSRPDRIMKIASFLIPGLGNSEQSLAISMRRSAIASGSWFGKGLGAGVLKDGQIEGIFTSNVFCAIAEEIGVAGVVMLLLFFGIFVFIGYGTAKNIRKQNPFYSNLCIGVTTMVIWQTIINMISVLGLIPSQGTMMPFFSYGPQIIATLLECGLLYRIAREKINTTDQDRIVQNIQEELMFPEKYEFENN